MRIPGVGRLRQVARGVARAARVRSPRGVILLYHRVAGPRFDPLELDVAVERFDAQIAALARETTVLPLGEFEVLRRAGQLPPRAAAVTFDDGYADNLAAALPVLTRHRVPATVFVTTSAIGATGELWWDDVERIAFTPHRLTVPVPIDEVAWAGEAVAPPPPAAWTFASPTPDPTPRHALYRALIMRLRRLPPDAQRDAMQALRSWAGVADDARPTHRTMRRDELQALAAAPGITIGAHTVHHPVLAFLPVAAQQAELAGARDALADLTGTRPGLVAYPYGTTDEVSDATAGAAAACGFDAAFANEACTAWKGSDRWRVPRLLVRDWPADEFARRLATWWSL